MTATKSKVCVLFAAVLVVSALDIDQVGPRVVRNTRDAARIPALARVSRTWLASRGGTGRG